MISTLLFSILPLDSFANELQPPINGEPYNQGPQTTEETVDTQLDPKDTVFVQNALETAKEINPDVTQEDIYTAIENYNDTRDTSTIDPPEPECQKNPLTGELSCKQEILPLILITAAVAAEWAVNTLVVAGVTYGLAVVSEGIKNSTVQNGWVNSPIWNLGNDMWQYKMNGLYVSSRWIGNYWIGNDGVMYDPTIHKSRWALIRKDNYSNYHKRWFLFNTGGVINTEYQGRWRQYAGRWMYQVPGNLGYATNESLTINGVIYVFDSNGYLYE